jgi:crossover junction endodeoxyribonuclease RuvC
MGIDPGVARVGWSIIKSNGSQITPTAFGCIETEKNKKLEERIEEIYETVTKLFRKYHPDNIAVEDLFFSSNAKTAIAVGQSRGVILLAAAKHRVPVVSYSPLAVKRTITGDGNADKKQVAHMVVMTLRLKKTPDLDDTTDALAIAMTHAYSYKMKQKLV